MVKRARVRLAFACAALGASVLAAGVMLAACFPDYGFAGGDAGGGDGSTPLDGPGNDGTMTGDGPVSDGAGGHDGSSASDAGGDSPVSSGDSSTMADSGGSGLDGAVWPDGAAVGMATFQPGMYHLQVYGLDSNGDPTDAAVDGTVTLTRGFALDVTEVTVGSFQQWIHASPTPTPAPADQASLDVDGGPYQGLMVWKAAWTSMYVQGANNAAWTGWDAGCYNTSSGDVNATLSDPGSGTYPVSCVNWFQAEAYCAWRGKRLPTVTEWRIAASNGGLQGPYPWGGAAPGCSLAAGNFDNLHCGFPEDAGTATGGSAITGVYDLVGSLDEWFWDFIPTGNVYAFPTSPVTDYAGPAQTTQNDPERQYLGGSYLDNQVIAFWVSQPGVTSAGGATGYDQAGLSLREDRSVRCRSSAPLRPLSPRRRPSSARSAPASRPSSACRTRPRRSGRRPRSPARWSC